MKQYARNSTQQKYIYIYEKYILLQGGDVNFFLDISPNGGEIYWKFCF